MRSTKTSPNWGIVPNDTKRCVFFGATKYQKHKRKYLKNRNIQKANFLVMNFVHKVMLTKYEVLTRIQLRYLECTKVALHSKNMIRYYTEILRDEHFFADFHEKLSRIWEFSGIFRNPSNFEELYLRAQEIFFDGTGTVAKIYV